MDTQMLTVSTKGQLVIPADVRTELGIQPGSRIALTVENARSFFNLSTSAWSKICAAGSPVAHPWLTIYRRNAEQIREGTNIDLRPGCQRDPALPG